MINIHNMSYGDEQMNKISRVKELKRLVRRASLRRSIRHKDEEESCADTRERIGLKVTSTLLESES